MAKELILQDGTVPLTENLNMLKVDGVNSCMEISQRGSGCRISGDLEVTGNIYGSDQRDILIDDLVCDDITCGDITCGDIVCDSIKIDNITIDGTEIDLSAASLTVDVATNFIVEAADVILDCSSEIIFKHSGAAMGQMYSGSDIQHFILYESPGGTDYFDISCTANGYTLITTGDVAGEEADLVWDIDGELTFRTVNYGGVSTVGEDIKFRSGKDVVIDKNYSHTTALEIKGLFIDIDRVGSVLSGTDTATGIDIDVNHTGASGGIIYSYGLDIDIVGDAGGTSYTRGIDIKTSGAGSSSGILINNVDSAGINVSKNDFTNVSSASTLDYFSINTIEDGETTLATHEEVGQTAHLNMVADGNFTVDAAGDISLDAQGGNITLLDGGSTYTPTASSDAVPLSHMPFILSSQFQDDLATVKHYLPLKGYFEQSFIGQEPTGIVAPFNMKLQKIIMRSSEDISGGTWTISMWAIASGSTHAHHHTTGGRNWTTVTGGAADTNAVFDFTGTLGLDTDSTGGSNAVDAGEWIDFQIFSDTDVTSSNAEFWITMFFIADLGNTV